MYQVYNALFFHCPMGRENDRKIKEIKTIGRGYRRLKTSALLFSSSAEVWTCAHNIVIEPLI